MLQAMKPGLGQFTDSYRRWVHDQPDVLHLSNV